MKKVTEDNVLQGSETIEHLRERLPHMSDEELENLFNDTQFEIGVMERHILKLKEKTAAEKGLSYLNERSIELAKELLARQDYEED